MEGIPDDYNVSLLQGAQLQWLFFVARHFADVLVPSGPWSAVMSLAHQQPDRRRLQPVTHCSTASGSRATTGPISGVGDARAS